MLKTNRRVPLVLNAANWLFGVAMTLITALVELNPHAKDAVAGQFDDQAPIPLDAGLAVWALAIAGMVAAHLIFTRLVAIIDTVAAHRPFTAINADRLRMVAWALLALQLVGIAYGAVAVRVSATTGEYVGWSPGIGGCVGVLLLFVLARIFRQGAILQDEVEATV